MGLKDCVGSGDVLLLKPRNLIGNIIAKITFGVVNHAAIVFDSEKIFETDADQFMAGFSDISKYDGRDAIIIRAKYIREKINEVRALCKKYDKNPYSYWDIITNATFFFLTRPIRAKVVGLLGNKRHMVCSELVSRILYEATGNKLWKDFEGITPEDIRDIALENPFEHSIKLYESKDKPKK